MVIYAKEGTAEPFQEEYLYLTFNSHSGIKLRLRTLFPPAEQTKQKLGEYILAETNSPKISPKSKRPKIKYNEAQMKNLYELGCRNFEEVKRTSKLRTISYL